MKIAPEDSRESGPLAFQGHSEVIESDMLDLLCVTWYL